MAEQHPQSPTPFTALRCTNALGRPPSWAMQPKPCWTLNHFKLVSNFGSDRGLRRRWTGLTTSGSGSVRDDQGLRTSCGHFPGDFPNRWDAETKSVGEFNGFFGAGAQDRTADLLITNQLLYP